MEDYKYFMPILIGLLSSLVIVFFQYIRDRKSEKKAKEIYEKLEVSETEKLLATRKTIDQNYALTGLKDFWSLIDNTRNKSDSIFKFQIGLLIDLLHDSKENEILDFYGKVTYLLKIAHDQKVFDAFQIIAYKYPEINYLLFLEWLICQGEVYFNNYTHNPDLIANSSLSDFPISGIYDALHEIYHIKTSELLPEISGIEFNELDFSEDVEYLSERFPRLWDKYIN